jgi:rod shape-determining protein MreC
MFKRQKTLVTGTVVLGALVLLNLPGSVTSQIKMALGGFFVPLFRLESAVKTGADAAAGRIVPRAALEKRIAALREENNRLRTDVMQLRDAARENHRLREMLDYPHRTRWPMIAAEVIGMEPANWWSSMRINVGLKDGVTVDAPVLCPDGLVGKVAEVFPEHSQVVLIGDPKCAVSAMALDTGESGILQPRANQLSNPHVVDFAFLPNNAIRGDPRFGISYEQWDVVTGKLLRTHN